MVRLLPMHLVLAVVAQLAAGAFAEDPTTAGVVAAGRGCSAVDPFRALGSERYSCWTCGSSIDAAAARCKDVCRPDEMEDEAFASRELGGGAGDQQQQQLVDGTLDDVAGPDPPASSLLPPPALPLPTDQASDAAGPPDAGAPSADPPQAALPRSSGAASSTAGVSTPSPDVPFLSFEDWKALQLAAQGHSGGPADDVSAPVVPNPSPLVVSSLLSGAGQVHAPSEPNHDHPAGGDPMSQPVDRSPPSSPGSDPAPASGSPAAAPPAPPVPSAKSPSRRFNYASLDCSARVHYSSPQTRSPSALLHKSKDRYMLTPCAAAAHFVVIELCDEIRIDTLEVGNFEFFSSVVKDVRVRAGESEGDGGEGEESWKELGTFRLANLRGVQPVRFDPPTGFHRFLRLDFLGYYGSEYYCPVSLVRVYGLNQMEAYRFELGREAQASSSAVARDDDAAARAAAAVEPVPAPGAWPLNGAGAGPNDLAADGAAQTDVDAHSPPSQRPVVASDGCSLSASPTLDHPAPYAYPTSEPASEAASRLARSADILPTDPAASSAPAEASSSVLRSSNPAASVEPSSTGAVTGGQARSSPAAASGDGTSTLKGAQSQSSPVVEADSSANGLASPVSTSLSSTASDQGQPPPASASASSASSSLPAPAPPQRAPSPSVSVAAPRPPAPPPNHRAPPPPQPPASDSGESIYSSIVRRLAHLESTSSLATQYLDEQSRMVRAALQQLEQGLATWKAGVESAEKNRWAGGLEGLRAQQERMLRTTTREWDAQRREFERERRELAHRLALMNSEITLHRWLLGGTLLLLLVLLACFFAIRVGSVEMVPVPDVVSRATQKLKEKNRRSTGDTQDALRRRAASPLLRGTPRPTSPTPPSDLASTPPMGSLARPRVRHHSNTPTKRSFPLVSGAGTTPAHLVAGRSVEVGRPKSILGISGGGGSHRKAAREAHIHTLAHARLQGGHAKKRSMSSSLAGVGIVPGDQTPKRRFGTLASHANVGLGIDSVDHASSSGGEGSGRGFDDGWTPASTTDDDSDDDGGGGFAFTTTRSEMDALQDVKVPIVGSGLVSAA